MLVGRGGEVRGGEGKGGELSRKSMHLIRIEIIDKKFALISTIDGRRRRRRRGGEEEIRISPHYRSVGRRQGSCAVFGGCSALSTDLAKANAFLHFYHKTQFILNEKYIQRKGGNS